MKHKLLPLVVLVLALCSGIAWFVLRGAGRPGFEKADNPRVELPQANGAAISAESSPLEARSAEKGEAGTPGANSSSAQSGGTGTLRLLVLDEKTRAPIAGLGFVVYRERGGVKELARGTTDAAGRAELREIEANTVIVCTERKPPHAESYGAVWLTPGATKDLEILAGAGSAVTGRVIDDLGHPVEGAELHIAFGPQEGTSGTDGRFRLECLASRPTSVWIVDGEMRPEHWDELWLYAIRDNTSTASAGTRVTPVPGKAVDVGDLVLARAAIYTGHLLDSSGGLVAGAVLSAWGEIPRSPADPDFQLQSGEVLTDATGRFEYRTDPAHGWVLVATRSGAEQRLRLPEGKPGERIDGIELRLAPELVVELELVDARGAPAEIPAPLASSAGVITNWRNSMFGAGEKVRIVGRSSDGARETQGRERADGDGKWRAHLPVDPRSIGELDVFAAGYASVVERSEAGFPELVQRKLTLVPYPAFHVRLVRSESSKRLAAPGEYVGVHICLADPARHAAAGGRCCGLGAYWNERWTGEPLDLVLAVRRGLPFWIYARGPRPEAGEGRMKAMGYPGEMQPSGGLCDLAHIGPFEPGPEVRELVLDTADFVTRKEDTDARKPPDRSQPGEEQSAIAHLRAHIDDARTGKPIPGAWIHLSELAAHNGRGSSAGCDANGDIVNASVPVGRFAFGISLRGYKPLELGEHTTREGEVLDLGTLALEPLPTHRGRVLDLDGTAPARAWLGVLSSSSVSRNENGGLTSEPDGSFALIGELPPSFVLQVVVPVMHAGWGGCAQRFLLEPWPEGEVKELRLAKPRKVVVTITGIDPEEAELVPSACPAAAEPTATCDHRAAHVPPHEQLERGLAIASSSAGKRYAFLLAPGRYQLWGSNLMHELPVTDLEVTPGDTDLELTITAH